MPRLYRDSPLGFGSGFIELYAKNNANQVNSFDDVHQGLSHCIVRDIKPCIFAITFGDRSEIVRPQDVVSCFVDIYEACVYYK